MKKRILQKAAELFLTHGVKSVTMDDIAGEIGISKKTIYKFYDTKTKLVEATTMFTYEVIVDGIENIHTSDLDPITEMYEVKKFMMARLKGENASPVYQLHKYYPEIYQKVRNMQFDTIKQYMGQNLQRGIKQGLYRERLNPDFVWRIYFLGINGIKNENLFPKSQYHSKELHEEFLSYHLRGIVTKEGLGKLVDLINEDT